MSPSTFLSNVYNMFTTLPYFFGAIIVVSAGSRFNVPSPPPRFPAALNYPLKPADVRVQRKGQMEYGSAWERSGLFEGDIATSPDEMRNAIISPSTRWSIPIPVYINRAEFDSYQVQVIEGAIAEIEQRTCVRFRAYQSTDTDFIVVRGNSNGCWSSVGRKSGGQTVNLQRGGCTHHGIAVHEFLHALGLYHQQSATERDSYIAINWQNIQPGREHNFMKSPATAVTSFNLPYDYGSLMHYGKTAFSANGMPTITPKQYGAEIGQRVSMSALDMHKIKIMYGCISYDPSVNMTETNVEYDDYEQYLDLQKD